MCPLQIIPQPPAISPSIGSAIIPQITSPGSGWIPPIFLPKIRPDLPTPAVGRRKKSLSIGGYSTSFAGYAGKVKGSKATPTRFGKFTGFEIRPLGKKGKVVFEIGKQKKKRKVKKIKSKKKTKKKK